MLRQSRQLTPVPRTYALAGGIGLVLGVVADWVLTWQWGLVAAGFVAAVWLFFMASVFWGIDPVGVNEFLEVLDPARAHSRRMADPARAVVDGELQVFAAADWAGPVALSGWGRSRGHFTSATLRLLDPDDEHHWVEVESIRSLRHESLALRKEQAGTAVVAVMGDVGVEVMVWRGDPGLCD